MNIKEKADTIRLIKIAIKAIDIDRAIIEVRFYKGQKEKKKKEREEKIQKKREGRGQRKKEKG